MINVRTIRKIQDEGGLTLKGGRIISHKTGYQVADYGVECTTPEEAIRAVKDMQGNCGIWFSGGIYYIDHSFRVSTKKEAVRIGIKYNQISVLKWSNMSLVYCK